jgi:hypothetical protein
LAAASAGLWERPHGRATGDGRLSFGGFAPRDNSGRQDEYDSNVSRHPTSTKLEDLLLYGDQLTVNGVWTIADAHANFPPTTGFRKTSTK